MFSNKPGTIPIQAQGYHQQIKPEKKPTEKFQSPYEICNIFQNTDNKLIQILRKSRKNY